MVSVNNGYNYSNMYPAVKSGVNHYVQTGDVAKAIKYARGERADAENNSSMAETIKGIPLGLAIMGGLNSIIWGFGGLKQKFWNKTGTLKDYWNTFVKGVKATPADISYNAQRAHRLAHHTEGMVDGLKSTIEASGSKEAKGLLAQAGKQIKAAKTAAPEQAVKLWDEAELLAMKAKNALPAAAVPEKFFEKMSYYAQKPFRAIFNNKLMKQFSETKIGRSFFRGGGTMFAVIEGGIEAFTEVIPAFKEKGFLAGIKQIGKSAAKVTASVGGFLAGEALGAPLGAMLGAAVGGPIGAWLGGFIGGMGGGLLLSGSAVSLTKSITGKTEMEKVREEKLQEEAATVMQSPQQKKELAERVLIKAQQELSSGNSQKAQEAAAIGAQLAEGSANPFVPKSFNNHSS